MLKRLFYCFFIIIVLLNDAFAVEAKQYEGIIHNKGQKDNDILFYTKVNNGFIYFKKDGLILQRLTFDVKSQNKIDNTPPDGLIYINNVGLKFKNYNTESRVVPNLKRENYCNFFIGNNPEKWITEVSTYNEIVYENVYEGIDVKYYVLNGSLKYDFIVKPNAAPSDIEMVYEGNFNLNLSGDKQKIFLSDEHGEWIDDMPLTYQRINGVQKNIESRYRLIGENTIKFELNKYNQQHPLIIDPVLVYSTYIGGSQNDFPYTANIHKESNGNVFATGRTISTNFPTTVGSFQTNLAGNYDCFLFKLNNIGTGLIFSTYIGGSGYDGGYGVKTNSTGEIIITGAVGSSNFPLLSPLQAFYGGGPYDGFITIFSSNGASIIKSTYWGGASEDIPSALSIDNNDNIIICGETNSSNHPVTAGAYQTFAAGSYDATIMKFNPTLSTVIFSTYFGGSPWEISHACDVDNSGNIYISGYTKGQGTPTTSGAFDQTFNGGTQDVFVTKFSSSGSLIYSTYLGSSGFDMTWNALKVTASGEAIVAGYCANGFPVTSGAYDVTYNGGSSDVFVTKLNAQGSALVFSTYIGGPGADDNYGLDLFNGKIYITGSCQNGYPVTSNTCVYDATHNGLKDVYVSILDSTGSLLQFSSYLGGSSNETGIAVLGDINSFYVAGETYSSNFPVTSSAFDQTYNLNSDVFITKIALTISIQANINYTGSLCTGSLLSFNGVTGSGFSHFWDFGDNTTSTFQNPNHTYFSPGTYNVMYILSDLCGSDTAYQTITINNSPIAIVSNDTSLCGSQTVTLTASGGSAYTWSGDTLSTNSSITVTPLQNSTYYVQISNGICSVTDTINVYVTPLPIAQIIGNDSICMGDSLTLTASGGSTFQWIQGSSSSNNSITVSPVVTTTYIIQVSNAPSCFDFDTLVVEVLNLPSLSIYVANDSLCLNQSTLLVASGANNYSWLLSPIQNNDSVLIQPNQSSFYTVIGTDSLGCSNIDSVYVTVLSNPSLSIVGNDSICNGQSTLLTAQGNGSFQWIAGASSASSSINVSPANTTLYVVQITDSLGCVNTDSINVHVFPLPNISLSANSNTVCQGSPVQLYATGANTYSWSNSIVSNNDTVVFLPSNSTYIYVTGYSVNNCSSIDSIFINVLNLPIATIIGDTLACAGQQLVFLGMGGNSYTWYNNSGLISTSQVASQTFNNSGSIYLVVSNGICSSLPDTHFVRVMDGQEISFNIVVDSCKNTILLKPLHPYIGLENKWTINNDTFITNGDTLLNIGSLHSFDIELTINNGDCEMTSKRKINTDWERNIIIPNIITPNGDGKNDRFYVSGPAYCLGATLKLFNRWGQQIFETNDLHAGWDALINGNKVEAGVYFYTIEGEINEKGTLTILY
jgi:gliding motility-associated-like protein